jgi:uncharacterized membrane protein YsdA (DUF1294 family)
MVFIVFGVDKFFAMKNMYRISEKNLLALAIFGGGLGALLGQRIFRHKTKKFGNILLILSIVQIIGSMVYVIR